MPFISNQPVVPSPRKLFPIFKKWWLLILCPVLIGAIIVFRDPFAVFEIKLGDSKEKLDSLMTLEREEGVSSSMGSKDYELWRVNRGISLGGGVNAGRIEVGIRNGRVGFVRGNLFWTSDTSNKGNWASVKTVSFTEKLSFYKSLFGSPSNSDVDHEYTWRKGTAVLVIQDISTGSSTFLLYDRSE